MARKFLAKFARLAWIRIHKRGLEYILLSRRASLHVAATMVLYRRRKRVIVRDMILEARLADYTFGD